MRNRLGILFLAFTLFLVSIALVVVSLERGSKPLAVAAAIGNLVAALLFAYSMIAARRGIDWKRIQAEQRLWESGPLGRKWLRVRRRIYDRWRL